MNVQQVAVIKRVGEEVHAYSNGKLIARSAKHKEVFESALRFLAEAGGGELIIYSGEYLVSDIPLHSNVKIYGFGRVVLKLSDGEAVFRAVDKVVERVTIDGIEIRGSGEGIALDFGKASSINNIVIGNVVVDGFRYGFRGAETGSSIAIARSRFINCFTGLYVKAENIDIVSSEFSGCEYGVVGDLRSSRIIFTRFARNGVGVKGFDKGGIQKTQLIGNVFQGNKVLSAELGEGSSLQSSHVVCEEPCEKGVELYGRNIVEGNMFSGVFSEAVVDVLGDDVVIASNIFYNISTGRHVVRIGGGNATILGNTFHNVKGVAIDLENRYSYPIIVANHFSDVEGVVIRISQEVRAPLIALNSFSLTKESQILVHSNEASSYFPTIIGNTVYVEVAQPNPLLNLKLKAPGAIIAHNMLRAMTWRGASATILAGDARGAIIEGNVFSGVTPLGIIATDEYTTIANNYGLLSEVCGEAVLRTGMKSTVIEHGLGKKPKIVLLTPHGDAVLWIGKVDDKVFEVVAKEEPKTDITISWCAKI